MGPSLRYRLLALLGPPTMSDLSAQCATKRTSINVIDSIRSPPGLICARRAGESRAGRRGGRGARHIAGLLAALVRSQLKPPDPQNWAAADDCPRGHRAHIC